jgi:catechol 2,3-dioxygenase-like lactoylglutathione lyase family enzyme
MDTLFIGLAHICIFTLNLEKSVSFYTDNLHFQKVYETYVVKDDGNIKYAVVKLNNCVIELLEPDNKDNIKLGNEGIIAHIALEVKNLKTVVADLKTKNVEFTTDIFAFDKLLNGVEGAFIKGPSGELIELFEYKNKKPFY